MKRLGKGDVTVIKRSCLTGKAVWVYRGPSQEAARKAYWRAKKAEPAVVKAAAEMAARRKANILRLLSAVMAGFPAGTELPPEKKAAARQLASMAEQKMPFCRDFYDHIIEEQRRRDEDREIRRQMREREGK